MNIDIDDERRGRTEGSKHYSPPDRIKPVTVKTCFHQPRCQVIRTHALPYFEPLARSCLTVHTLVLKARNRTFIVGKSTHLNVLSCDMSHPYVSKSKTFDGTPSCFLPARLLAGALPLPATVVYVLP